MLRRLLFCCALLLPSFPILAAQYQISGRVTKADLVTPIAQTQISLYHPAWPLPNLVARVWTDADGRYAFNTDCSELCDLNTYRAPYFEESRRLPATAGAVQMDFALRSPATISGQVRAGIAIAGAIDVRACRDTPEFGYADCGSSAVTAQGEYRIDGLQPGNYRVCTDNPNQLPLRQQCFDHRDAPALASAPAFDILVLADGETRTGVDFDLQPGAVIAGHVRDALTDEPVDAEIEIYDANGELLGLYDGSGDYRTGGLAPGTYYVRATTTFGIPHAYKAGYLYGFGPCNPNCAITAGTPLTVTAGATLENIDFAIAPRAIVRGTVRDAATQQPLAGVRVRMLRLVGILFPAHRETTTAADGSYAFYASPGSQFRLHADGTADHVSMIFPALPCPRDCDLGGEMQVVAEGSDTRFDFALPRGGTIGGQIIAPTPGMMTLSLHAADDGRRLWSHAMDVADPDYVSPAVLPGSYFVRVSGWDGCEVYANRPCATSGTAESGTPVPVSAGQITSGIDFVFDDDFIFHDRFGL